MVGVGRRKNFKHATEHDATDMAIPGAFALRPKTGIACWCCPQPVTVPKHIHKALPSWQFSNPHLLRGYRCGYTALQSAISALPIVSPFHNESVNIWTHLLPGIYAIHLIVHTLRGNAVAELDGVEITMLWYYVSAGFMFLASAIYHTFNCVSEDLHTVLLRIDMLGIAVMIAGSYVPAIWMGFHCQPAWRIVWLLFSAAVLLAGIAVAFGFVPDRHKVAVLFVSGASGSLTLAHWCFVTPSFVLVTCAWRVLGMFAMYALGTVIFVKRWPEAYFQNLSLEFVGASHQIWHLCVLAAACAWWSNCEKLRDMWRAGLLDYCAVSSI